MKLIHGEKDDFVPCYMSEEIRNANPERVTLCVFPDAVHGTSYMVDPARYEQENAAFWAEIFGADDE